MIMRKLLFFPYFFLFFLPLVVVCQREAIYESCRDEPGACWGYPEGCESGQTCSLITTWRRVNVGDFEFESQSEYDGAGISDGVYVAVGFSTTPEMSGTTVVVSSPGVSPVSQPYWNPYTPGGHGQPREVTLDGGESIDTEMVAQGPDYTYVRFTRPAIMSFPSVDGHQTNDIAGDEYYLVMASGPMDGDEPDYHQEIRGSSSYMVDFTSTLTTDTTTTTATTTTSLPPLQFDYGACGVTKSCTRFAEEEDECLTNQDCAFVASWADNGDQTFTFEVQAAFDGGDGDDGDRYLALGFSEDSAMGEDTVVTTSLAGTFDPPSQLYWNVAASLYTVAVTGPPQESNGVDFLDGAQEDSYYYVSFVRDSSISFTNPEDGTATVDNDLGSGSYYLLVATGPLDEAGLPDQHDGRDTTEQPVDFTALPA